jgi:hypothetical protein
VRIVAAAEVGLTVADFGEAAEQIPTGSTDPVPTAETELQLRRLLDASGDAVLRRDSNEVASTWTDDGEWQRADGTTVIGRRAIEEAVAADLEGCSWLVQTTRQAVITMEGPHSATGRVVIDEQFATLDGVVGSRLATSHDHYVRRAGGPWRFASRRVEIIHRA